AQLADDVAHALAAVDLLEHAELLARDGPAGELGDLRFVADEDLVEVGDLALDHLPLVDAPVSLEQHPVDVERETRLARGGRGQGAEAELEESRAPAQRLV